MKKEFTVTHEQVETFNSWRLTYDDDIPVSDEPKESTRFFDIMLQTLRRHGEPANGLLNMYEDTKKNIIKDGFSAQEAEAFIVCLDAGKLEAGTYTQDEAGHWHSLNTSN